MGRKGKQEWITMFKPTFLHSASFITGKKGEITTTDLLLGIWSEVESPGHKILAKLGFNDEKAKELESLSSGPEFVDG